MNYFVFDIETGTAENAEIFKPEFEANKTLKDPEKVKADLEKKESDWLEKTPLSAMTGKILCIGVYRSDYGFHDVFEHPEHETIRVFWEAWNEAQSQSYTFVGHNIFNFDLPYLIQRSWVNGIKPPNLFNKRYWNDNIKDTMELWNCNRYPKEYISLNNLAKVLDVGSKTDDGKRFQELWINDRQKALDYLKNDLELTSKIYEKIK